MRLTYILFGIIVSFICVTVFLSDPVKNETAMKTNVPATHAKKNSSASKAPESLSVGNSLF